MRLDYTTIIGQVLPCTINLIEVEWTSQWNWRSEGGNTQKMSNVLPVRVTKGQNASRIGQYKHWPRQIVLKVSLI